MPILISLIVGWFYLTFLENKGVNLDPDDMSWKDFGLVLLLIPIIWLIIILYILLTNV